MSQESIVAEFRWIEAGAGLPVVCLHGLFGASEHWDTTLEALAPDYRAMALTLPIFETPPDDLSVTSLRRHVEAFLDAERVPPAVIVGNSLGGHVALDLALHAPERVRALVLTRSSGLFERSFTRGVPHRPSAEFVRVKMAEVFHDPAMVTAERVEIQVGAADPGLTLMLDYGIFYEFVPVADLPSANPRRLTIAEVRLGEPYVILLTTPAGLWSYVLGDTVRFVSLSPPQLVITGRTRHFVNAFGENVIVEEVERAAAEACARTRMELVEFTVAPVYPRGAGQPARHEGHRVPRSACEPRRIRASRR